MLENPDGYAFVAFSRSYEVTMSYDWAAALKKHDYFPTKYEYIAQCKRLWVGLSADNEQTTELAQGVIRSVRQALYADVKGKFKRDPDTNLLEPAYMTVDTTERDTLISKARSVQRSEPGYEHIEDRDEMKGRLRLLRNELTSLEYKALVEYMYGGHDNMKAATDALSYTHKQYDSVRRSMRYKGRELAWIKGTL